MMYFHWYDVSLPFFHLLPFSQSLKVRITYETLVHTLNKGYNHGVALFGATSPDCSQSQFKKIPCQAEAGISTNMTGVTL